MIDTEYLDRLVRATPVKLYASGVDGARCFWPWRMNKAGGAMGPARRRAMAAKCDHYVLDSNFKDETITNRDVLDEAADMGADAAVLADVYQDMEATVPALLDGLDLADDHRYDGTVVLPLQAPHDECYREVAPSVARDVWWAIGGLKDESPTLKIEAAQRLRQAVGQEAHIHGLGYGVTDDLARYIRSNPEFLDSIDNSTSTSNSVGDQPGRAEKATVSAAYATAKRLETLRKLTPYADRRPPEELRQAEETGLEEFA